MVCVAQEDNDLPWACLICREPFTNPVVTKCKHYFCEKCALARYVKDTKCFACNQQTHGVFQSAARLARVMELRVRRIPKADVSARASTD